MTDSLAAERPAYHYAVIARALAEIDAGGPALSLEDLAARIGLSPAHFQRIFSQWVGVSPKRYQQYLTLDHARRLLAERFTVLDTALATGLSGPGRLHDLFLRWEAMSPGDFARAGEGLEIGWAWVASPFGEALAMATPRGLCGLAFSAEMGREAAMADLAGRWPAARLTEDPDRVVPLAEAAFGGAGADLHLIARRSRSRSGRPCCASPRAMSPPIPRSPSRSATLPRCGPWARRWGATRSRS